MQIPQEGKKLLTDRTAYIAYLESQLERVSAACLTVQSFDERLTAAASNATLLEQKVCIILIQYTFILLILAVTFLTTSTPPGAYYSGACPILDIERFHSLGSRPYSMLSCVY